MAIPGHTPFNHLCILEPRHILSFFNFKESIIGPILGETKLVVSTFLEKKIAKSIKYQGNHKQKRTFLVNSFLYMTFCFFNNFMSIFEKIEKIF